MVNAASFVCCPIVDAIMKVLCFVVFALCKPLFPPAPRHLTIDNGCGAIVTYGCRVLAIRCPRSVVIRAARDMTVYNGCRAIIMYDCRALALQCSRALVIREARALATCACYYHGLVTRPARTLAKLYCATRNVAVSPVGATKDNFLCLLFCALYTVFGRFIVVILCKFTININRLCNYLFPKVEQPQADPEYAQLQEADLEEAEVEEGEAKEDEVEEAELVELLPIHSKRCGSVLDYSSRLMDILQETECIKQQIWLFGR